MAELFFSFTIEAKESLQFFSEQNPFMGTSMTFKSMTLKTQV